MWDTRRIGLGLLALIASLSAAVPGATTVNRPEIVQRPIPFGAERKQQMTAYSRRHYGDDTFRLVNPKVIVEHFTATTTFSSAYNTFAQNRPDPELHELPGTCAHFIVDTDGTIYQLVSLSIRCRHTVGLNWTAIGIENVGMSDLEILNRPSQMRSIIALTRWLRCREGIGVNNVIGHNESLDSPYHRENVPLLRRQTHGDWTRPHMNTLRRRLRAAGSCAGGT
jgi:N-acetylmuramoyl-L-alanine amidase